ncbi:DNA-3-methyladenine glycosylase family protein [Brevibacillus sp. TJ4]|uniref:DNA-3-methyladenine glycosylase family protein n=1 Tax=Brevibacillus sp. TJ4 TaxID=3234853 RepID=UPI003BA19CDF
MFATTISMCPPYSFERLMYRLQTHPDPLLTLDPTNRTIRYMYVLGTKPVLAHMQFTGGVDNPAIRLSADAALTIAEQQLLEQKVRHMFSADVDLTLIYRHMREHEKLAHLPDKFRGLRFLLDPDLFQSMVRTIIGQQVNLAFATALTYRFMELAGNYIEDSEGGKQFSFPTVEAVSRLKPEDLRPLQFSQRKAEYIIDFARAIETGQIDLERLWHMEDEAIIAYLGKLRGIGRWSVECLMMFGMGRLDLLPAADVGLRNGIHLLYEMAEKPDEKQIRQLGESWAPWRSYYSLYVWEIIGEEKRKAKNKK